ncbi:MAG: PAS domain S-box protein [bacterium]
MTATSAQTAEPRAAGRVSGRFLTDLFRVLERHDVPAFSLLGDLPVPRSENGAIVDFVDWSTFTDLMQRLERELGGPEGMEACGGLIGELEPAGALRRMAGLAASPLSLYRGAIRWALQRALPGIETQISVVRDDRLEVRARLADRLRPCPQIFHFATGGARALPRILGMSDAVVAAEIGTNEATYQITLPPSLTLFARARRALRSLFSAGSVLEFLEAQQLELHAQHDALQRAHDALAESEQRHRARTDAAADVLCEIDADGRIAYVSASVQDLIGYTPEQVTGSHYRLWLPREFHSIAGARFEAIVSRRPSGTICQEVVALHADRGRQIKAEISVRSYESPEGDWRMVGILRDRTARRGAGPSLPRESPAEEAHDPRPSIEPLRATLARFGTQGHPLHRSLEILIAALEWTDVDRDATEADRLTEATRRMTLIVDGALVHARAADAGPAWIETRKLLDSVRVGCAQEDGLAISLPSDPDLGQVWGRADLLATALGSLVDHAFSDRTFSEQAFSEQAFPEGAIEGEEDEAGLRTPGGADRSSPGRLRLEVQRSGVGGEEPGIDFVFRRSPDVRETGDRGPAAEARGGDLEALSLAIARDAAALMDAEVLLGSTGEVDRGTICRLRIPQPEAPARPVAGHGAPAGRREDRLAGRGAGTGSDRRADCGEGPSAPSVVLPDDVGPE